MFEEIFQNNSDLFVFDQRHSINMMNICAMLQKNCNLESLFNLELPFLSDFDGNFPSNLIINENNIVGINNLFKHI